MTTHAPKFQTISFLICPSHKTGFQVFKTRLDEQSGFRIEDKPGNNFLFNFDIQVRDDASDWDTHKQVGWQRMREGAHSSKLHTFKCFSVQQGGPVCNAQHTPCFFLLSSLTGA